MKLENDAKFEGKLTCGLENDIRMRIYVSLQWRMMQTLNGNWLVVSKLTWGIWRIFTRVFKSFINLHFNGFLLNKVCNVWSKKVQRIYVSWHWRVMGNLKKKWLKVWKMTWGIWKSFTRALESLKIVSLMGSFYPKVKAVWT